MINYRILFFCILLLTSCKNEQSNQEILKTINVPIHSRTYPSPFGAWVSSMRYKNELNSLYGISQNRDSVVMLFDPVDPRGLKKVIEKRKKQGDTLNLEKNKSSIHVLTGLEGENQFVIIDQNRDNSFNDDKKYVFPAILGDSMHVDNELKSKFEKVTLSSMAIVDSVLINDTINFSIVPDNYFVKLDENRNILWLKRDRLFLQLNRFDYLYGAFKVNEHNFKIAVNKSIGIHGYHEILIEKKGKEFKKMGDADRLVLKLKDTVELAGSYYKIEEIIDSPIQIILKELEYEKPEFGIRKGDKMRNFRVKDLYLDSTNLNSMVSDKKYMLLDFWGTWCGPCKELTPDLVKLHSDVQKKVSFVSLAYQLETGPIIEYVKDNKLEWNHVFIQGKPKSGMKNYPLILKELRVEAFPTFILLNDDFEILFRGNGTNFPELEEIIRGL